MNPGRTPDPRDVPSDVDDSRIPLTTVFAIVGRFWRFVRPYRGKFVLGLFLVLLAVPLGQFALFLTRDVTNKALLATNLTSDERWATVVRIITLQAVFYLLSASLSTYREVLEWYTSMRSTFDLRLAFYRHLHRLPMSFLSQRPPGEHLFRSTADMVSMFRVIARPPTPTVSGQSPLDSKEVGTAVYSNDVDPYDPGVMGMITKTTPLLLETIYSLAWGAALLYLIDPLLSLALVLYIVPFTLVSQKAFEKLRGTAFSYKSRTEYETAVLRDSIAGLRLLKALGRTRYQLGKFLNAAAAARRRGIQQVYQLALAQSGLQMGMKWLFAVVLYTYVAARVMSGHATVGDWVATFLLVEAAQAPLENFVQLLQLLRMQVVPAQRILETLDVEPTLQDPPGAPNLPRIDGRLTFEDVRFSYEPGRPALRGVSFDIQPGEYVGIVGPSGAGKSSVLNLFLRLYQPDSGRVSVDGHDVSGIRLQSLLDQVGTVPQSTFLYSGTIADNVFFGNPWASDEDFEIAVRDSGVAAFASRFQDGLLTEIGEGATISGGERQRIGIARALVRNPRLLILDEATANLDPATEDAVLRTLQNLREGRTIVSVAHRLKAVMGCDRIIVLQEGEVAQIGTHGELLATEGLYRKLWQEQTHDTPVEAPAL
jgi:subfamily B ATP-binding cassette protein MsbA